MSENEFIQWLKGYTQGVHHYSINPQQWQTLKDKLELVNKSKHYQIDSSLWTTSIS